MLKPVPVTMPLTSSQPGSSPCLLITCTRRPSGPGLISSISPMICSKRPSSRPGRDPRLPAAAVRRGALEDPAEELDPLVEVEVLERVDPERLEEAARRVQILLVRRRVAHERDALRPDVDRVRPLVDRRDPGADDDVAAARVVLLRRVRLHDPVGERGILARLREHGRDTRAGRGRRRSSRASRGRRTSRPRRRGRSAACRRSRRRRAAASRSCVG